VGFEPTIPAFERVKRVHVLDTAATLIGQNNIDILIILQRKKSIKTTATGQVSEKELTISTLSNKYNNNNNKNK
jgi:hypothetical protein